jgi:hypothetical protein
MTHGHGEDAAKATFSDLPVPEGMEMAKKMPLHSTPSFANELTYPGYNHVSVSYVFCEDDVVLPPDFQQACIDRIEEASGNKVHVTKLKAGHTPEASVPREEAKAIDVAIKAVF